MGEWGGSGYCFPLSVRQQLLNLMHSCGCVCLGLRGNKSLEPLGGPDQDGDLRSPGPGRPVSPDGSSWSIQPQPDQEPPQRAATASNRELLPLATENCYRYQ